WTLGVGRSTFSSINVHPDSVPSFRRALLSWYRKNGRDLPWRRTTDPYAILVSEFMLQQTQVATAIPYYNEWLRRFPDFASLAAASEQDVLHAWQGLGYYARARNLRAAAIAVMEEHAGVFPRSPAATRELPGIGRYSANAIATFAFDQSVPIVEANIARVIARLFDLQAPIDTNAGRESLWTLATQLLPQRLAGRHNSALMELGALVCGVRPKCEACPVREFCCATNASDLPRKSARPTLQLRTEHHRFVLERRRLLLEQSADRWRGMWILPRLAAPPKTGKPVHLSDFPFTHHRITLAIYSEANGKKETASQRWFRLRELESIPLPSPHRRALNEILTTIGAS
ncbi:MAG: A/G-specific adenine glycosylase, partial [Chthoniobacterales bacterium]